MYIESKGHKKLFHAYQYLRRSQSMPPRFMTNTEYFQWSDSVQEAIDLIVDVLKTL